MGANLLAFMRIHARLLAFACDELAPWLSSPSYEDAAVAGHSVAGLDRGMLPLHFENPAGELVAERDRRRDTGRGFVLPER